MIKKEKRKMCLNTLDIKSSVPTVPMFYERETPDSHRNIFIIKTLSLVIDSTGKLISNIFSGVKMNFCFQKISEESVLMQL